MLQRLAVVLTLAVLLTPGAAGSWSAAGSLEPDTIFDVEHGSMWLEPDVSATSARRVYLNGFQAVPQTAQNPNSATLGSRILPPGAVHHRVILGVWKDCNADGYIGLPESAIMDYSARILTDKSICPSHGDHNDGTWVSELLSIGMIDPCERASDEVRTTYCPGVDAFARNERVLYDEVGTYVWADLGIPDATPRTECILAPLPHGTTTGTGALIRYLDCQSERGIVEAARPLDPNGELDQPFPVTPFGTTEHAGILEQADEHRAFTAWDCGSPRAVAIAIPGAPHDVAIEDPSGDKLSAQTFPWVVPYSVTGIGFRDEDGNEATPGVLRVRIANDEGHALWAPMPAPALHDPTTSWWSALEHTADGPNGDCDPTTGSPASAGYPGHAIESDQAPIQARKDRPSLTFVFYDGHRGLHPSLDPTTGPTAPSDGGLLLTDPGRGGDGPIWNALTQSDQDPQLVNRGDLGPTGARYFTYYAFIGSGILNTGVGLANGASTSVYGSGPCPTLFGDNDGWACDPRDWWKDQQGNDNRPRYALGEPIGRAVGDRYHLRDVDCYDGSVNDGSGVRASLADLSAEGACRVPESTG